MDPKQLSEMVLAFEEVEEARAKKRKAMARLDPDTWARLGYVDGFNGEYTNDLSAWEARAKRAYYKLAKEHDQPLFHRELFDSPGAKVHFGENTVELTYGWNDPADLPLGDFEEAPFGDLQRQETRVDHDVRCAKQFKGATLSGIDFDLLKRKVSETLANGAEITLHPHAANCYTEGGHFDWHVDTPRHPRLMLGTLVFILPYKFSGGELLLRRNSEPMHAFSADHSYIVAVAMHGTTRHCVHQVTAGTRLTVTYDIHLAEEGPTDFPQPSMDKFVEALEVRMCKESKPLGLVLRSSYTPAALASTAFAKDSLDTAVVACLTASERFSVELHSVLLKHDGKIIPGDTDVHVVSAHLFGVPASKTLPAYDIPCISPTWCPMTTEEHDEWVYGCEPEIIGKCVYSKSTPAIEWTGNESETGTEVGIYMVSVAVVRKAGDWTVKTPEPSESSESSE